MAGIPETVTVDGKVYTQAEVLSRLGEKYKGFDPTKLAGILKLLFTIFQSLLPLFMKDRPVPASPEHERLALAMLATAADLDHPVAAGPITDSFLFPAIESLGSYLKAKLPEGIDFVVATVKNAAHVYLP